VVTGSYKYATAGAGPRQLTDAGGLLYGYDGAGRMTDADGTQLTYDPYDRLVRVDLPGGDWLEHHYGHDGMRSHTVTSAGDEELWFSPHVMVDGRGDRTYYQSAGTRLVARVRPGNDVVYMHAAVGAGPTLITNWRGGLLEEREYEPHGAPLGAAPTADVFGYGNRPVDPMTGWSDHGARWLAPEIARWGAPDPPALLPSAAYSTDPWRVHPYQHVVNNPMLFWDPDGREEKKKEEAHKKPEAKKPERTDEEKQQIKWMTCEKNDCVGADSHDQPHKWSFFNPSWDATAKKGYGYGPVRVEVEVGTSDPGVNVELGERWVVGYESVDKAAWQDGGSFKLEFAPARLKKEKSFGDKAVDTSVGASIGLSAEVVADESKRVARGSLVLYVEVEAAAKLFPDILPEKWKYEILGGGVSGKLELIRLDKFVRF
jgi:RHS repeat-associated protein